MHNMHTYFLMHLRRFLKIFEISTGNFSNFFKHKEYDIIDIMENESNNYLFYIHINIFIIIKL